jgi:hypothetical protein
MKKGYGTDSTEEGGGYMGRTPNYVTDDDQKNRAVRATGGHYHPKAMSTSKRLPETHQGLPRHTQKKSRMERAIVQVHCSRHSTQVLWA